MFGSAAQSPPNCSTWYYFGTLTAMQNRNRTPAYRHYRPKDLAVVRIRGKDHYLGRYDSPESWRRYHQLIADDLSAAENPPQVLPFVEPQAEPISIKQLCLAYFEFSERYYEKEARATSEVGCIKHPLRRLLKLYGDALATEFGPKALKNVRDEFIRDGFAPGQGWTNPPDDQCKDQSERDDATHGWLPSRKGH